MDDGFDRAALAPLPCEIAVSATCDASCVVAIVEQLGELRSEIATTMGVVVPSIPVSVDESLAAGECAVRVHGTTAWSGTIDHDGDVVATADAVVTASRATLKQRLSVFLTRDEVSRLLDATRAMHPVLVAELVPNLLSLGQIRQVLHGLVESHVSITDLPAILEALADQAMFTKDPRQLTEHARVALRHSIIERVMSPDGVIRAFILSPDAERTVQNSIQFVENTQELMLDPVSSNGLYSSLSDALTQHASEYRVPVVVVNGRIRRHIETLLTRHFPELVVLGYGEITFNVMLENLETLELYKNPAWQPEAVEDEPATPGSEPDDDKGDTDLLHVRW